MYVLPINRQIPQILLVLEIVYCYFDADVVFCILEPRYGYAIASALHGVKHILRKDFMLQV
jgi:hypothetical protein